MTSLSGIDGNTLDGVSATTLWTLHNRGTEAKRSDGGVEPAHRSRYLQFLRSGRSLEDGVATNLR